MAYFDVLKKNDFFCLGNLFPHTTVVIRNGRVCGTKQPDG